MYSQFTPFVTELMIEASRLANNHFGQVTETIKLEDRVQIRTEADLAISHLYVDRIQATYPKHDIIDEELGVIDNGSAWTWVCDSVDGTMNFAAGTELFGTMVGLLHLGQPVLGAIALPRFGRIILGVQGRGTFDLTGQELRVTAQSSLKKMMIAYSWDLDDAHPKRIERQCLLEARIGNKARNIRSSNSCYDAVMVAQGSYGAWLNPHSRIWDNVPVQAIIEAAGGIYTDILGNPIDYSDPLKKVDQNFRFLMGAPAIHAQVLAIIQANKELLED